jgi:hypothetical protein
MGRGEIVSIDDCLNGDAAPSAHCGKGVAFDHQIPQAAIAVVSPFLRPTLRTTSEKERSAGG